MEDERGCSDHAQRPILVRIRASRSGAMNRTSRCGSGGIRPHSLRSGRKEFGGNCNDQISNSDGVYVVPSTDSVCDTTVSSSLRVTSLINSNRDSVCPDSRSFASSCEMQPQKPTPASKTMKEALMGISGRDNSWSTGDDTRSLISGSCSAGGRCAGNAENAGNFNDLHLTPNSLAAAAARVGWPAAAAAAAVLMPQWQLAAASVPELAITATASNSDIGISRSTSHNLDSSSSIDTQQSGYAAVVASTGLQLKRREEALQQVEKQV